MDADPPGENDLEETSTSGIGFRFSCCSIIALGLSVEICYREQQSYVR